MKLIAITILLTAMIALSGCPKKTNSGIYNKSYDGNYYYKNSSYQGSVYMYKLRKHYR